MVYPVPSVTWGAQPLLVRSINDPRSRCITHFPDVPLTMLWLLLFPIAFPLPPGLRLVSTWGRAPPPPAP